MHVYYSKDTQELLTENEVEERIAEEIDRNDYMLEELEKYELCEIYDMLSDSAKNKLFNNAFNIILKEDYIFCDFNEEEV